MSGPKVYKSTFTRQDEDCCTVPPFPQNCTCIERMKDIACLLASLQASREDLQAAWKNWIQSYIDSNGKIPPGNSQVGAHWLLIFGGSSTTTDTVPRGSD